MYNKMIIKTKNGEVKTFNGYFNADSIGEILAIYNVQSSEIMMWARTQIRQARPSEIDYIEFIKEDSSAIFYNRYSYVTRVNNDLIEIT